MNVYVHVLIPQTQHAYYATNVKYLRYLPVCDVVASPPYNENQFKLRQTYIGTQKEEKGKQTKSNQPTTNDDDGVDGDHHIISNQITTITNTKSNAPHHPTYREIWRVTMVAA